ncbi:MAG: right-handed parallel beta-helix repeat-containing protein [Frankia sp.]
MATPRPFLPVTFAAVAATGLLLAGCQAGASGIPPSGAAGSPTASAATTTPGTAPTSSQPTTAPPTTAAPSGTPAVTQPPSATASTAASGSATPTIVVAPSGNDGAAGTLAAPFATVQHAVSVAQPGSVIALRAGVYQPTAKIGITVSGTAAKPITLTSYGSEHAVLDGSKLSSGDKLIITKGSYWDFDRLELRNSPQQALYAQSVTHTVFRRLDIHDNHNTGLDLTGAGASDNLIENIDSHGNHDDVTKGQNADGIGIKFGSGAGNVVRDVRVFDNADDGIDLWEFSSPVTIEGSWSYGNGVNRWNISGFEGNGNGFKLGGGSSGSIPSVGHVVQNNASWDNTGTGFTENGNPGPLQISSDTAYANGSAGFYFKLSSATLRANLSVANATSASIGGSATATGNSWSLGSYSASSFVSVDATKATGARAVDGSLPAAGGFLRLVSNPHSLGATLAG